MAHDLFAMSKLLSKLFEDNAIFGSSDLLFEANSGSATLRNDELLSN